MENRVKDKNFDLKVNVKRLYIQNGEQFVEPEETDKSNGRIYFQNSSVADKVNKFLEMFEIDMLSNKDTIFFREKDSDFLPPKEK